ncbi:tyrosine-type recombinase/integrase [Brevundimonas sp.]|uniref:tyrosine-type recombinase/integrase n=1 Tax=unclassified Brevundimonas TaxID=2622653 RepID=UPI003917FC2B
MYVVTAKGRTYHYAWRGRGAPRLLSKPGTPEFIAELNEALATRRQTPKHTVAWLCTCFRGSEDYTTLAASTRRQWTPWIDRIQEHFGTLSLRQFDRPQIRVHIRKWRDQWRATPRTADYAVQVLSRLLSYAVGEGHIQANPCKGIPSLYRANRSEIIWTQEDIQKLCNVASPEISWAVRLAALTGQRQGDLLKMAWSHVGLNSIEFTTGKSRNRRTVIIPIYQELRQLLDSIPKRATTILTNSDGLPWRSGFGSSWNKALKKSGLKLHFHDLRGTAATRFYGRLTVQEIAMVVGWSETRVDRMIDRYVKKDELLRDTIRRLENGPRT